MNLQKDNLRALLDEYIQDYRQYGVEQIAVDFLDYIRDRDDDSVAYYSWLYSKDRENMLTYLARHNSNLLGFSVKSKKDPFSSTVSFVIEI